MTSFMIVVYQLTQYQSLDEFDDKSEPTVR